MQVQLSENLRPIPLKVVGGNNFGKHPKISDEQTFNMFVSDDFLVNYAGYKIVGTASTTLYGRATFTSERYGNLIVVIGNGVFSCAKPIIKGGPLQVSIVGRLDTFSGQVSIDENLAGQIAICDGSNIYIFNWVSPTNPALIKATLPVDEYTSLPIIPGYITYQNGHFNTVNKETGSWFLSQLNNGLDWNWSATDTPVTTTIQTKATNAVAVLRAPGLGNLLYVFGGTVTELWYYTGQGLFPYQRSTSVSFDYGCLSPNTIASMDQMVCWLGINEKSGPVIMAANGAEISAISDDGIDYKLGQLVNPQQSNGFFFKQDGHLFYQITFSDPKDNFTLFYDFNTKIFFSATDENMNYHIAESVAFFNDSYYFVSLRDGNIYQSSTKLYTYDYTLPASDEIVEYEIPCVRVLPTFRKPDGSNFRVKMAALVVDQGNDNNFVMDNGEPIQNDQPALDCAVSKDGGETFTSFVRKELNPSGKRRNRVVFRNLGIANEITFQFRFFSKGYKTVSNGVMEFG